MKKGGVELNLFGKADNKELAEVNIPKNGYNPYIQDGRNRGINIGEERQNEQKINNPNNDINLLHENIINNMKDDFDDAGDEINDGNEAL